MNNIRYQTGLAILKRVDGANRSPPLKRLQDIAPDLADMTVAFAYGEIMSRRALDLPTRQLCTVAGLAALGNAQPQLRYHIAGALNVGSSPEAITETLLLCAVFAGFPAAINGMFAAKDVFEDGGVKFRPERTCSALQRYERGLAALEAISAGAGETVIESLTEIAPDLARFIIEFSYGDVISRGGLENKTKELVTVAMLTAKGTALPQLKVHISAALNVGATQAEVVEVIQQMAVYAGFPAALNGINVAKEVFSSE